MTHHIPKSGLFYFIFLLVFATAVPTTGLTAGSPAGDGEFATYRYDLVMSKDDKVCKHMQGVYNWSFARPFDFRGFSKAQSVGVMPPLQERYPTSEEFEAVQWRYPKIFTNNDKTYFALPVAEFDIDNDGKKDIVIKTNFFNGTRMGSETLHIYQFGEIDLGKNVSFKRLHQGEKGKRPRLYDGEAMVRPFILEGTVYLSVYNFSGPDSPAEKGWAHQAPQKMEVKKYVGGGIHIPAEETPIILEDICRFNMLRAPR